METVTVLSLIESLEKLDPKFCVSEGKHLLLSLGETSSIGSLCKSRLKELLNVNEFPDNPTLFELGKAIFDNQVMVLNQPTPHDKTMLFLPKMIVRLIDLDHNVLHVVASTDRVTGVINKCKPRNPVFNLSVSSDMFSVQQIWHTLFWCLSNVWAGREHIESLADTSLEHQIVSYDVEVLELPILNLSKYINECPWKIPVHLSMIHIGVNITLKVKQLHNHYCRRLTEGTELLDLQHVVCSTKIFKPE